MRGLASWKKILGSKILDRATEFSLGGFLV